MPHRFLSRTATAIALAFALLAATSTGTASATVAVSEPIPSAEPWQWPVTPVAIVRPFIAPAHPYGPGHRGIDLAGADDGQVRAPASGVIAFAGVVVDRPLITIDHGDGLVTTLEPVVTDLTVGTAVLGGDHVGSVPAGGHDGAGAVHFGVRRNGEYINPLLLLGGVPRAVLLPCC